MIRESWLVFLLSFSCCPKMSSSVSDLQVLSRCLNSCCISQAVIIDACVSAAESNALCLFQAGLLLCYHWCYGPNKILEIQWLLNIGVIILSWTFSIVSHLGLVLSLQDWNFHLDWFIAVTGIEKKKTQPKNPQYKTLQGTEYKCRLFMNTCVKETILNSCLAMEVPKREKEDLMHDALFLKRLCSTSFHFLHNLDMLLFLTYKV